MQFDFDAGKYAPYLWTAVGVMVVAFAALIADTVLRSRRWRKKAEALQAARDAAKDKAK